MRYEHWLWPAKPSPWPGAVLCLSCDVRWVKDSRTAVREYATLVSWHVQLCVRQGGAYAVARSATGTTADSFWDALRIASLRGRNVWVISTRFREVAAVLGLWERLESGHVTLAGADPVRVQHPRGSVSDMPEERDRRSTEGQAGVAKDNLRRLRELLHEGGGIRRSKNRPVRRAAQGVCIIEDPPVIINLKVDGGHGKITWADAANYGLSADAAGAAGALSAPAIADWLCKAASALHTLGPCGWQSTAASQSMHLFRSVYHETPILCHTHPLATALERDGLFGGRCEPYQLGHVAGPVHMYDFRSLYPYLYSTTAVPTRLLSVREGGNVAEILEDDPSRWRIARVDIETDAPEYPYRHGHAVIYPTGRFTTCLCGPELARAAHAGHIRRVRSLATYKAEIVLGRYATELYRLRQHAERDSNKPFGDYIKRLMVCLHGKFAQTDRQWVDIPGALSPAEWGEWWGRTASGDMYRVRAIAGRVQREEMGGFSNGTVPSIAAAITSAGRARLLSAIESAGWDTVHYCDTDAIILSDHGRMRLLGADWVRPGEWGYLQHVLSADSAEIYGVKHYRIGARARAAGVARDMGGRGMASDSVSRQPAPRESLRVRQMPADWRETHPYHRGPGRYDQLREPGGRVRPVELDEWEAE